VCSLGHRRSICVSTIGSSLDAPGDREETGVILSEAKDLAQVDALPDSSVNAPLVGRGRIRDLSSSS
jgi:hypothetical protein